MNADRNSHPRFHLAIPVHDLAAAQAFYGGVLRCPVGRSTPHWIDFDLYGHQLVTHLDDRRLEHGRTSNPVDGHDVPIPHFGVLLDPIEWRDLADCLAESDVEFVIEPHTRFVGEIGAQSTMFLLDPSGNALEFKSFADDTQVFAS